MTAAPVTRVARGLGALVAIVALLIGVPWLLLVVGRMPDPRGWSWDGLVRALTTPDDGAVLIMVISLVAWVAWAVVALSVLLELANVLSRRRLRLTLPGLRAPQALAAVLLLAVAGMVAGPVHAAAEPAPVPGRPDPGTLRAEDASPDPDAYRPADHRSPQHAPQDQRQRSDALVYVVKAGDDLWTLADRFYGDGAQWRRIADANSSLLTGGPDELIVGWKLTIPGVSGPAARSTATRTVTVRAGDTLTTLAERHYGDPAAWRVIFDANRDTIRDPDQIGVGWTLTLPPAADERAERTAKGPGTPPQAERPAPPPDQEPRRPETAPAPTQPPAEPTRPPAEPEQRSPEQRPTAQPVPSAAATPDLSAGQADDRQLPARLVALGAVGGLLAASLVAGLLARREWQLMNRPVGRRIPHPPATAQLVEGALGRTAQPLTLASLDLALRAVALHCRSTDTPVPELELALAGAEQIELRFAGEVPTPPVGFTATETGWLLDRDAQDYLESVPGVRRAPHLWPALICVGRTPRGGHVLVNLEAAGLFSVRPPATSVVPAAGHPDAPADREALDEVLTAVAMELSFSPWSGDLVVTAVGDPGKAAPDWLEALSLHTVRWSTDADAVIARAAVRAEAQRALTPARSLGDRRLDPTAADAWTPELLLFTGPLRTDRLAAVERLMLGGTPVSLAAIVLDGPGTAPAAPRRARQRTGDWVLELGRDEEPAWLEPAGIELAAQRVEGDIRTSLVELVSTTGREDTVPAPWWSASEPPDGPQPTTSISPSSLSPVSPTSSATGAHRGARVGPPLPADSFGTVTFLGSRHPARAMPPRGPREELGAVTSSDARTPGTTQGAAHPVVRLLGPIDLLGASGPPPPRATRQCIEYCAWLLEHPGASAAAMADALCVAEGTRRSNMSRLRTWLGDGPDGQPYLPDAYSGRIFLDPMVTSDWHRMRLLVGAAVNRSSTNALVGALELVRGAPLADAAPGQWYWAEELRTDMVSMVRDIGVQLARAALADQDVDLARWAANRALAAAPGDEILMCERIRTEHRAGNPTEVERLVLQVQGRARSLGVDLADDTVDLMQRVVEGNLRARHA